MSTKAHAQKGKGGRKVAIKSTKKGNSTDTTLTLMKPKGMACLMANMSLCPKGLKGFVSAGDVSSKEVKLRITKFIDWDRTSADDRNVLNVIYNMKQDLLAAAPTNDLGLNSILSRVKRVKLYAYPRSVNGGNASSVYAVLTSVPTQEGGGTAAHQQSVVVTPTFTPEWHKVFDCNFDKLFSSSSVLPADRNKFPLFNTSIVDVDTLEPILGTPIQLKIEIEVAQTVPLKSQVSLGFQYQLDYSESSATLTDEIAFVQVTGMSDRT